MRGRLFVVGTPIGNLGDLSPRAAAALTDVAAIYCEDTRVTARLLAHIGIRRRLVRCDAHTIASRVGEVLERLRAGERLAYASDAGMPGISDPGCALIDAVRDANLPVEVVPGPSASITALVASGIASDRFFFEGFLPRKRGARLRRLAELACVPGALILYESPHRVEAALEAIAEAFPERTVALCRELTKLHEEVVRAPALELLERVRARDVWRGEIVLVIAAPSEPGKAPASSGPLVAGGPDGRAPVPARAPDEALDRAIRQALADGEPLSSIARRLARPHALGRRDVYERGLAIRGERGGEVR